MNIEFGSHWASKIMGYKVVVTFHHEGIVSYATEFIPNYIYHLNEHLFLSDFIKLDQD